MTCEGVEGAGQIYKPRVRFEQPCLTLHSGTLFMLASSLVGLGVFLWQVVK